MRVASHARGRGAEGVDWRRNAPGAEPLPEHRLAADRGSAGLERGERGAAPMRRRFDARPARGGVLLAVLTNALFGLGISQCDRPCCLYGLIIDAAHLCDCVVCEIRELRDGDLHATARQRRAGWRRETNRTPAGVEERTMYRLGTMFHPPPHPSASRARRSANRMATRAAQSRP